LNRRTVQSVREQRKRLEREQVLNLIDAEIQKLQHVNGKVSHALLGGYGLSPKPPLQWAALKAA